MRRPLSILGILFFSLAVLLPRAEGQGQNFPGGGTGTISAGVVGQPAVYTGANTVGPSPTTLLATSFGVKANTKFVYDATFTINLNTITCATTNDCNFTAADNGKICFGTNLAKTGFTAFLNSAVILPQGVLTVVSAQSATCSGGNATATQTANGLFVWGSDDTTALQAAWTATLAVCGTLQLPGINSQGTGPAVMLVQSATLSTPSFAANNVGNCDFLSPPADRAGVAIRGVDVSDTIIGLTPNFSAGTCTFGGASAGTGQDCFFAIADGGNISDVSIFGFGISAPGAAFSAKVLIDLHANNNAAYHHVNAIGYGASGGNGISIGINISGLSMALDYIEEDGAGQIGIEVNPVSHTGLSCWFCVAYDNSVRNLQLLTGGVDTPFSSYGGFYGDAGNSTSCIIGVSGLFNSFGDKIGAGDSTGQDGLCVGVNAAGGAATGTAHVYGSTLNVLPQGGNKVGVLVFGGAAQLYAQDFYVNLNSAAGSVGLQLASTTAQYYDRGGNQFLNAATQFSNTGPGSVFGSGSVTGVTQTTGNIATTSGWGTTSVTAVTGNSLSQQFSLNTTVTGTASPVLTITFPPTPHPFLITPRCTIQQVGGTFTLSNPTHVVTTTTDTITFTGTPTATQTYTFVESCTN